MLNYVPGLRNLLFFCELRKKSSWELSGTALGRLWMFVNGDGSYTRGAGAIGRDRGNDCVRSGQTIDVGRRKLTVDDGSIAKINHAAGKKIIIKPGNGSGNLRAGHRRVRSNAQSEFRTVRI